MDRWSPVADGGILWDVATDARLPHADTLEMSGRRVSAVVRYAVDAHRMLKLSYDVFWPTLRIRADDVRGTLTRAIGPEHLPTIIAEGVPVTVGPVERIVFDGVLTIVHREQDGIALTRRVFVSPGRPEVIERWTARNGRCDPLRMTSVLQSAVETEAGMYGEYRIETRVLGGGTAPIPPGADRGVCTVTVGAYRPGEVVDRIAARSEEAADRRFARSLRASLVLETPDPILDRAFEMAKHRAAESVFETRAGLLHSPGGSRYYAGVWANDQAEYAGPFFPFLGEHASLEASANCYRLYAAKTGPAYEMLPSSFEMEGDIEYHAGGDRGDAAMVAYGAARFAMAAGDREQAAMLWRLVRWCLEYCHRHTTSDGVIASDTDELEGRFPTGCANLSTSSICYGALRSAAHLGRDLGHPSEAAEYDERADRLRNAIEAYFGAVVEGYETYRYYDGGSTLRGWICLPLAMGIDDRAAGTVDALFSDRLWHAEGLRTEAGNDVTWDRATLYALRGALRAGFTAPAMDHLRAYTRRRLLGDHVPYPVEAMPEGNGAHLAAESALYCRVITEGLFGIEPTGTRTFRMQPRLPDGWDTMALRSVHAFGGDLDIAVERCPQGLRVILARAGRPLDEQTGPAGTVFAFSTPRAAVRR